MDSRRVARRFLEDFPGRSIELPQECLSNSNAALNSGFGEGSSSADPQTTQSAASADGAVLATDLSWLSNQASWQSPEQNVRGLV
jgi:hypothetical protein